MLKRRQTDRHNRHQAQNGSAWFGDTMTTHRSVHGKRGNRKCAVCNAAPVSAQRAAGRSSWPVSHSRASRRLNLVASVSLTCAAQEEIPRQQKNILTRSASGSHLIGSHLSTNNHLCFVFSRVIKVNDTFEEMWTGNSIKLINSSCFWWYTKRLTSRYKEAPRCSLPGNLSRFFHVEVT